MVLTEYKLFVHRIGLVGITNLLISISSIILLPILTKNLTIQNYGVWVQFVATMGFIPLLINLGLPYSMVRFLAVKKDEDEIKDGFYSITFILSFVALITSILILIFSKQIALILFDGNTTISLLLSLSVLVTLINSSFISYFRTFQQMGAYSIITLVQTYVTVAVVIFIVESGYGLVGVVFGNVIIQIIILLFTMAFVIHQIGFKFPKFHNIKEYLSFGVPTVPGNLSNWMIDLSDRYIIGILIGIAFVGYYSPGYTLGNIILMLLAPFTFLLAPLLSSYYDQNKIEEVEIHLQYSLKYFLLLSIPAVFGLSILSKPLLTVLSTPEIAQNGYLITPIVAIGAFILGVQGIIGQILALEKKTKIIGSMWMIGAFINVALNIIFVPMFGIVAAAISTLIAYSFTFTVSTFYSLKYIKVNFDWRFIFKSLIASILMSFVILFISPTNLVGILITILISFAVYLFVVLLLKGISSNEIEFFKRLIRG